MDEDEKNLSNLVALALAGRPASLVDLALADAVGPEHVPHARAALAEVSSALAALAIAEPAVAPSAALRGRLLSTIAALERARRAPRTALLVVDMQNDHLLPGRTLEVPRAREIVPALVKRLASARSAGIPIIYVCDAHAADDPDLENWGGHNIAGTDGAAVWPELAPQSGDHVVYKPTYSGFTRSPLENTLRSLRVDTLELTGCLTEMGLFVTATDALQRGYAVNIPPDTQAGATAATENVVLRLLQLMPPYGAARADLLAALAA